MTQQPPELNVEIHKVGNEFFAVTKQENGREVCTNRFRHDPTGLTHLGPLWLLERGALAPDEIQALGIEFSSTVSESQVARYGGRLYGYLFGGGRELETFLDENKAYQNQVRLTISLHPEAAALWRLPWEYLHNGDEFLCLSGRILLNRMPGELKRIETAISSPPLRILVVVASPDDQKELDVERELAVFQEALDPAIQTGKLQLDVLDDATLPSLQQAFLRGRYHVLHYIGHGAYSHKQHRGFLCFEDEIGDTDPITAYQLGPVLMGSEDLHIVVISACQSAQIGVLDAFDNVATGLLHANVPAVLALPNSLQDESAVELLHEFYNELAKGRIVDEALFQGRLVLHQLDQHRPANQRRFDWGVPALYSNTEGLRILTLAQPARPIPIQQVGTNVHGLPLPRLFVGRREALRRMRQALQQNIRTIYLWGESGVGKSTLAAMLIKLPGIDPDDVLVIRCAEMTEPVESLGNLANFWRFQGEAGHNEAAALLLDTRRDPAERSRKALQAIGSWRYLIVFDRLDAWFDGEDGSGSLIDETMRDVLRGLISARANSTLIFTGRRPWTGLNLIPNHERLELQIMPLTQRHAILLMSALPRQRQLSLEEKLALHRDLGGHPLTLMLAEGWLSGEQPLGVFLQRMTHRPRANEPWLQYLLNELLDRLDPGEYDALTAISVIRRPFTAEVLEHVGNVSAAYAAPLLERWLALSLLQYHNTDEEGRKWYAIHPLVRQYLQEGMDEAQHRAYHLLAATYYGMPFLDEARRQVMSRSSATWSDEQIEWLARSGTGILGLWIRQTRDMQRARRSINRALAWQYHLFEAQDIDAASQILHAVVPVINRWGHRDLSKSLLRHSADALQGHKRAEAFKNLARMWMDEGRFNRALEIYEKARETIEEIGNREMLAQVLEQMGHINQRLGDYESARDKFEAVLQTMRVQGDETGQAGCLRNLARLYRETEELERALSYAQAAEELDRRADAPTALAYDFYEQGRALKMLGRNDEAFEAFRKSLEFARRVGDDERAAEALHRMGQILQGRGNVKQAVANLHEAAEIYQQAKHPKAALVLEALGQFYEQQESWDAALKTYQQALEVCHQLHPAGIPIVEQHITRLQNRNR